MINILGGWPLQRRLCLAEVLTGKTGHDSGSRLLPPSHYMIKYLLPSQYMIKYLPPSQYMIKYLPPFPVYSQISPVYDRISPFFPAFIIAIGFNMLWLGLTWTGVRGAGFATIIK